MTIATTDIKLRTPERLTDLADGGGRQTSGTIVDELIAIGAVARYPLRAHSLHSVRVSDLCISATMVPMQLNAWRNATFACSRCSFFGSTRK